MTRPCNATIIAGLAALLVHACAPRPNLDDDMTARDPRLAAVSWLCGHWVTKPSDGAQTEELWTEPRAGTMLGLARQIEGLPTAADGPSPTPRTVFFEFLRIELTPEGEIIYLASPKGRSPPTPFKLLPGTPQGVMVFRNPDHDFPQRIRYELRDVDHLHVVLWGQKDGQWASEEWTMTRVMPFRAP